LRGQEIPTQDLLDYRYRELFHMNQEELENEPADIYNMNISILGLEAKLLDERNRREEREKNRHE
jgi:hypothetical protein